MNTSQGSSGGGLAQIDTDLQELVRALNRLITQTGLAIIVPITQGGTGATTAAGARSNLGIGTAGTKAASDPADANVASVVLPVTVGHIAVFSDINGTIEDGGTNPSPSYATGTWTPALQFGGSSTGITYSSQLGSYTQIGREVTCRFRLVLTSKGAQTGAATIAGLPFASNADATNYGAGGVVVTCSAMASLSGPTTIDVGPSTSAVALLTTGATATAALTDANFTNTTTINGEFSYFV